MKPGIHPPYGPVAFRDRATGRVTLIRSTLWTMPGSTPGSRAVEGAVDVIEVDGTTYPVFDVDVTSDSHPFWTGTARTLDSEGRVEKFRRRYGAGS